MKTLKPYHTFKFKDMPFRWLCVYIFWNMGEIMAKLGLLTSKKFTKYGK